MSQSPHFKLSIIVPMYNEEEVIDKFFDTIVPILERLTKSYEIICVDDGSADTTLEKLISYNNKNPNIKILSLSRNFGHEIALSTGIQHTKSDASILIDADLQDPPELIEKLVDEWKKGYKNVYAVRESREGERWIKKITANLFYYIINKISDIHLPPKTGYYRLVDNEIIESLKKLSDKNPFLKGIVPWMGFKSKAVSFKRKPRFRGKAKWSMLGLWKNAIDGIVSFSTIPLKIWGYIGSLITFSAFLYTLFLLGKATFFNANIQAYSYLMTAILFIGGIILIAIGVIGEYIARIYNEVKGRPLYILKQKIGF